MLVYERNLVAFVLFFSNAGFMQFSQYLTFLFFLLLSNESNEKQFPATKTIQLNI